MCDGELMILGFVVAVEADDGGTFNGDSCLINGHISCSVDPLIPHLKLHDTF